MNRRNFLSKSALVAAVPLSILGVTGEMRQVSSNKRQVFCFPTLTSNKRADEIKAALEEKGFKNPVVICGAPDFSLHEVDA